MTHDLSHFPSLFSGLVPGCGLLVFSFTCRLAAAITALAAPGEGYVPATNRKLMTVLSKKRKKNGKKEVFPFVLLGYTDLRACT